MLKLRTILLSNKLFYIILAISLIYTVYTIFFVTYKSKYETINDVIGYIEKIEKRKDKTIFRIKAKETIICYYDGDFNYHLGDYIKVIGEELPLTNNTVLNTFNYKKYLYNKKIFHILNVKEIIFIKRNNNILLTLKDKIMNKSINMKSFPYINALLMGNKDLLDEDAVNSYRNNGISHLFAISGLHVGIFVTGLMFLLKKAHVKENKRYLIIIVFIALYMFITNFSMSITRAGIYTILCCINEIYYFYIKKINLLLLTLSLILFVNPLLIFDIGLQYSFSITFFLLLFKDKLYVKEEPYLKNLFKVSLICFLVSIPITINSFYQLNILSVIYNLLFVPYISYIILPSCIFCYIFVIFDKVLFYLLIIMEKISLFCESIDFGKIIFCKPNWFVLIVYYLIIIFVANKILNKEYKFLLLLLIFMVGHYCYPLFNNEDYLLMLDVGQGDSFLLKVDDNITLIDTGGYLLYEDKEYSYSIARNKILPYLKSCGITKIDNLILSHGDADHMQESIYIIKNYRVNNIYLNSNDNNSLEQRVWNIAKEKNISIKKLQQNTILKVGKYKMYSLNKNFIEENASSLVLYTKINNYKLLFLSDINKKEETYILDNYKLHDIDVLKIAHHGSKNSSDYDVVRKLNPKLALISAGLNNKFNHPNEETLTTLENLKIKYYRTDYHGSVKISLKNGTITSYVP